MRVTTLMLMIQGILFLKSVLSKETKLMYKRAKDWILCQLTGSSVAGIYLLRDSLSCCNKETQRDNGLTNLESYLFLT